VDLSQLVHDRIHRESCEHDNEPSGFVKYLEFLKWLEKDSVS
jgi:hypothetical protein